VGGEHDDDSLPPLLGEKACSKKTGEGRGRGQWKERLKIAFMDSGFDVCMYDPYAYCL
jgi:hypothetical protein